jgi:hypothetical protein
MQCDMKTVQLVSGSETFPLLPYKAMNGRQMERPYLDFLYCTGSLNNPNGRSNGFNYHDFMNGYTVYAFNLTRSQLPGNDAKAVADPPRTGDLQVQIEFRDPLAATNSFIFIMVTFVLSFCANLLQCVF